MLDFSALLSKVLFAFAFVAFGLNYDLRVVFYVGFRNFRKNPILKINQFKIKRPLRKNDSLLLLLILNYETLLLGTYAFDCESFPMRWQGVFLNLHNATLGIKVESCKAK